MDDRSAALIHDLGRRLFQARVAARLTVREVAQAIGIDHSMIVRYENAQSIPPLNRLIALADLYRNTPAALLASTDAAAPLIAAIDQADARTLALLAQAMSAAHDG
ncbi:helix-turn-helix domain-containing protein [Oscillochloris sp. ZM17-4]|uniref:helix-turn-helix domain-containing protein n=1 Tax=Oscillochloris sp. ZM17-4 TaxID=2866714 RepID=UPI001C72B88F|nr:helix-turn-helix transcriptional regulator [Oscillochloris sp. ZM17-4]MBX0329828.1 helix-turn-helix domain-containing protein [Oscillochloris sp. ZM17-4]